MPSYGPVTALTLDASSPVCSESRRVTTTLLTLLTSEWELADTCIETDQCVFDVVSVTEPAYSFDRDASALAMEPHDQSS